MTMTDAAGAQRARSPSKTSTRSSTARPAAWTTASWMTGSSATPPTPSSGCRPGTTTTSSPRTRRREISLIYYANRGGLEDRVFRIKTDRSSAPACRSRAPAHNITNVEIVEQRRARSEVRFNWFTLYYRYKTIDTYFGTSFYTIDIVRRRSPLIRSKKVVLKNDYIHHVVDIYHI